jgi:hypothetical protein
MTNEYTQIVQQLPLLMSKSRKHRTAARMRAKGMSEKVIKDRVWTPDPLARRP